MALETCSSSEILECSELKKAIDVIREERDRISELPDEILVIILSSIQTRDSVRTSTLSKRWRNVWTLVHVIAINSYSLREEHAEYQRRQIGSNIGLPFKNWFKNFVDRLTLNYDICCVRKLRLRCYSAFDLSNVRKWIEVVTGLDDLEVLDLTFWGDDWVVLPSSTFIRKNLVSLKLTGAIDLNLLSSVCLPSLKRLHLVSVKTRVKTLDVDSVEKVLTGCPVLENLHLETCLSYEMEKRTLHIQSCSLKSLTFYSTGCNYSGRRLKMVIDAINLERLVLMVNKEDKVYATSSLTSLVSVHLGDIDTNSPSKGLFVYKINVFKLLMKMPHTKYLYLSAEVLESLQDRSLDHDLPMLMNLTHCKVDIFSCCWPILSCLLESSPNLISFIVYKKFVGGCYESHGQFCPPKCLMLYLEEVKVITEGDYEYEYEMEMVRYFLENAPALQKMSITIKYLKPELVSDLHGKVVKLPKASTTCEICVTNY